MDCSFEKLYCDQNFNRRRFVTFGEIEAAKKFCVFDG